MDPKKIPAGDYVRLVQQKMELDGPLASEKDLKVLLHPSGVKGQMAELVISKRDAARARDAWNEVGKTFEPDPAFIPFFNEVD